nr:MAK10-like protein [Tanacetum cinerariifolium]
MDIIKYLTLYDNESWNDTWDFTKPVKAITLPQDVLSTSDRRLIELENQVQRLMEAHLALTQPTQVNKVTTSCEICSGPHDTQLNDAPISEFAGNSMALENIASISHIEREELRRKGIKIPSKLFSLNHNITKEANGEVKEEMEEDENTTSIIDHHLEEMAFGSPFIDETGIVYNKEKVMVMFKQNDKKITLKMPHIMEVFKRTWLMGLSTVFIPSSAYEENFGHGRTHYYQSLLIRDEYRQNKGDWRGIRYLMRLEKEMMDDKGEVMLYLMRRSLEVIRKFSLDNS